MRSRLKLPAVALIAQLLWSGLAWSAGPEPAPGREQAGEDKLQSRIDFGNAYIMGQTIKSGAVYLLNRKKSEIQSMLEVRKDYRREIREDSEVVDPSLD